MFYKLNGKTPALCTAEELGSWMEENQRTLACDSHGDITISTIFLGVDHSQSAAPLLFETLVFKDREATDMQRYGTWDEAETGHHAMVKKYIRV